MSQTKRALGFGSLVWIVLIGMMIGCGGGKPPSASPPKADLEPSTAQTQERKKLQALEASGAIPALERTPTLGGIDANGDGVRDDIALHIQKTYADPAQRKAAMQTARALQQTLLVDKNDGVALEEAAMQQALVFASIVLGIAVAFELQHLNTLLRSRRVTWHWAQPLFAFFVLMTMMSFWWMIASGSAAEEITLARFLPIMWVLVILNLLAAAALPDRVPDEGIDLAAYYQENRRYLWGLYLLIFTPLAVNWVSIGVMRSSSLVELLP